MKKIYLLLIGSMLFGGVAFAAEPTFESWTDKSVNTGRRGTPVRVVKMVRHASSDPSSPSLLSGDSVRYSLVSDDGVTVAPTLVSADGAFAGIVVTTIRSADSTSTTAQDDAMKGNWGWIIVHGPATANILAGGTNGHSAGDPFISSRDPSKITTFEIVTFSADVGESASGYNARTLRLVKATAATGGFFMNAAVAADTTALVYLENE